MSERIICILYREPSDRGSDKIRTLTYGDGEVRTYRVSNIDWRAEPDVFANTMEDTISILKRCDGTTIGVPISVAKELIGESSVFADPE